jgi:hypothetical protein
MISYLKSLVRPLVIETTAEKPTLTESTLLDLKQLQYRDGFKYILASLRFKKAVAQSKLVSETDAKLIPHLQAMVRAIDLLEADLRMFAQMDTKKSRPAEDEEIRLFKKVSASTTLV